MEERLKSIRAACFIISIVLMMFIPWCKDSFSKNEKTMDLLKDDIYALQEKDKEILAKNIEYIELVKTNYTNYYKSELTYTGVIVGVPYKVYPVDNPEKHRRKIYTEFQRVNDKTSLQYKLLHGDWDGDGIADRYSDKESGVRVIRDRYGVERLCVAIGSYWADGHIGRFVDFVMENGSVLPCVTCDVKQDIHTMGENRKYGSAANDLIEFYIDPLVRPIVDYCETGEGLRYHAGDVSTAREEFAGSILKVIVYDEYIDGFEFQMR